MTKALEIASRYFINELRPDTLKLQKLLYFAQGISFCMHDEELFSEQFEAWVHGPVVPVVYHKYKSYGYNPIDITYCLDGMTDVQKEILEQVKDTYGKYDGKYLENLTHAQDPWIYARSGLDPDGRTDKVIPKEIIADYFIGLMFQPKLEEWA
ncbi:MAG: DUF4065 domain-containing protein [Defluviitaleaceae bacterium]|nr:DUF4065 domain-containing protein [Defluviitaleaceae bacterium]